MVKISIIYYLNGNTKNLKNSINSLLQMNSIENVEIIIMNDCASNDVVDILTSSKILLHKNVKFVTLSQNLGHSYCYNLGLKISSSNYIYFAGQEIKFQNNFVTEILNLITDNKDQDLIVFKNNYDRYFSISSKIDKEEVKLFTQLDSEILCQNDWNLANKIFNKEFLIKNKIKMTEFHYYPALFVLSVFSKFKKMIYVHKSLAKLSHTIKLTNNLYDFLFQIHEFYSIEKKINFLDKKMKDALEFWTTKITLYDFINYVINSDMNDEEKELAISSAYKLNLKLYSNFFVNECFNLINENKWKHYFKSFKPKLAWIQKEFDTK
ncbi:glycosyltransferase family 2 protein [Mycoplasmoides alvi]|uniref:glycosyltransferase family 2 protein n=1 Tax=Mycoplasmoides alvi TaxID=78580 RepID=UPI00146F992A|nr:glycosyltransferase family 2 protein [Mycoplasmoides alvi]